MIQGSPLESVFKIEEIVGCVEVIKNIRSSQCKVRISINNIHWVTCDFNSILHCRYVGPCVFGFRGFFASDAEFPILRRGISDFVTRFFCFMHATEPNTNEQKLSQGKPG